MALTLIPPSGIDPSGNYTVNGITVSANASIANLTVTTTSNLGAVGNIYISGGTANYVLQTDGAGTLTWVAQSGGGGGNTSNISNGNSNVSIATSGGNVTTSVAGNANIIVVTGTGVNVAGTLNTTGNLTAGNISASGSGGNITNANVVSANLFVGSGANLTSLAGANVTGTVPLATTAGTVTTAAQPNITSIGSLTGLTVSNATGIVNFTTSANVTLGAVANLHISGGTANYVLQTDGAGTLTWAAQSGGGGNTSNISNGTSNVSIATSGGNVTTSVGGNANIIVVTGTGVNVAGTLNTTGNLTAGNISASGSGGNITNANVVSANLFVGSGANLTSLAGANVTGTVPLATTAGTVTTAAQPNITSTGTLTSLAVSGTANIVGNLIGGGELNVSGNGLFGGNLTVNGTLTYINSTTLSISDPIINLQTGPNGAAPVANTGKDVGTALNYYDTSAKIAWMGWDVSNAEIAFGSNVGISSEVVTFTSLANIRSGNANLGNTVTANFFTGNGSPLSALTFGNITTFTTAGLTTDELYLQATTRLNVTASGASGYLFDQYGATLNPALYVNSGQTLAFNLNVSGHPFLIQTSASANYSTGLEHVSTTGTVLSTTSAQGQISGTLYWKVPYGITGNYKYQCSIHGGMNGNIVVTDANVSNITVGSATTATSATTAGTVTTAAQPNITSVGSLTGLTISNATGIVNFTTSANVTLGAVANLHISGGTANYVLQTDGAGTLTWASVPGGANVTVDNFTGTGAQTIFTLSTTPIGINQTSVNYNGATVLRTDYTLANANITFSSAPANGSYIEVTTINLAASGGTSAAAAVGYSLIFGG